MMNMMNNIDFFKFLNKIGNVIIDIQPEINSSSDNINLIWMIPILGFFGGLLMLSADSMNNNSQNNNVEQLQILSTDTLSPQKLSSKILSPDTPEPWGLFFQDNTTPQMEGLEELHNNIMFYLTLILFAIIWMIFTSILNFKKSNISNKDIYSYYLELILSVIPALILILITFPSFKLLYLMDEVIDPSLVIHGEGHKTYWSYQYPDFTNDEEYIYLDKISKNFNSNYLNQITNFTDSNFIVNSTFDITPRIPTRFIFQLPDILDGNFIHYDIYDMNDRTEFIYIMEAIGRGERPVGDLIIGISDPSQVAYNIVTDTESRAPIITETIRSFPESYEELEVLTEQLNDNLALARSFSLYGRNFNVHSYDNLARGLVILIRRIWLTYLHAKGVRQNMIDDGLDDDLV